MDIANWNKKKVLIKTNGTFTNSVCMLKIDLPDLQSRVKFLFKISLYDQKDYFEGIAYQENLSQAVPWENQTLIRLYGAFKDDQSKDKIEIMYQLSSDKPIITLSVIFTVAPDGPEYTVLHNTTLISTEQGKALHSVIYTHYHQTKLIEKKLEDVTENFEFLKRSYDLIQDELKAIIKEKKQLEEELLKKFVSLLNAKKEKCRNLKQQLTRIETEGIEDNISSPISSPYSTSSIGKEDLSPKSFLNKLKRDSQINSPRYQEETTKTPTKRQKTLSRSYTHYPKYDLGITKQDTKYKEDDEFFNIENNYIITDPKLIEEALDMIQVKPEKNSDEELVPSDEKSKYTDFTKSTNHRDETESPTLEASPVRFPISSYRADLKNNEPSSSLISSSLLKESLFSPPKMNSDDSDSSLEDLPQLPPKHPNHEQHLGDISTQSPNKSYISLKSKLDKLKSDSSMLKPVISLTSNTMAGSSRSINYQNLTELVDHLMIKTLQGKSYNAEQAQEWCLQLSEVMRLNVKDILNQSSIMHNSTRNSRNFKVVAHVVIVQNKSQGVCVGGKFLNDKEFDYWVSSKYTNSHLIAIATVLWCYIE